MKKHILLATIAITVLNGCAGLTSKNMPPVTYTLRADEENNNVDAKASGILLVTTPQMPAGLDTEQIALYMDEGRRLDYYAGAKWPTTLDDVIQDVIVQTGRHQLPEMIINTPDMNIPSDYKLSVKINNFAPVYRGGPDGIPLLKISMTFTVLQLPGENVLAGFTLEDEQIATSNNISAVTMGLEELLQKKLLQAYQLLDKPLSAPVRAD